MKRKVKVKGWKKVAVTGALTATLGLGFWASKAFYEVKEVIDGDTFITKEDRYVRLDRSVDAPEIDSCLGKEAKEELEKLVLNKKVFIKTSYVDDHRRMISSVYTINGNVGAAMLEKGLAVYVPKGEENKRILLEASRKAREVKIGVYSSVCTQSVNPKNSKCNIKGNVRQYGNHYSHPGCSSYGETLVQLHLGDKWFCTEREAKMAGFIKGGDCR
ncbi:MAG: Succinoglycan biosynthesis protein ExoI [Candidatus Woesebacteria bacterium GW2011_GWB1_45_5]|uniref:Succinoglycan biosynthesis protein ExoI n=1 Tax=Candidatus Woesebacteria bacterium GW2011_GWB1_45_5 TaxID=1618581 RepID=A0A0G1MNL5_9BACT|nr:MAG: Succinoglycan biosynthesis protein ExoI [Candidatus Woesebacteria bacterium GW2011_GWB1_45_5]